MEGRREGDRNSHTWGNRSLPHLSPLQGEKKMMCVRLQHPSAAQSHWPCSDAARPGELRTGCSHFITETTLGNDSLTLSAHSGPGLFPGTHGRAQCPDVTQNESPSLVSRVKLCPESQGQAAPRALEEDWPLTPELPHHTPPTASQSFLPSPHTSILPNDSLNSQVIQNSRKVDRGQAGAFLLPTYHSLQYFTCFAFSR